MESFNELFKKIPSSIYNTKPGSDLEKLYKLYAHFLDDTLNVARELSELRDIVKQSVSSNSAVLDEIGEIVKEPRNGRDDVVYEKYLQVAITRNTANGSLESFVATIKKFKTSDFTIKELFNAKDMQYLDPKLDGKNNPTVFLDGSEYLNVTKELIASLQVTIPGISDSEKNHLAEAIEQIKPAGVEIEYN